MATPDDTTVTIWTHDASKPHDVSLSRPLQGDEEHLIAEAIESGQLSGAVNVVMDDPALRWEVTNWRPERLFQSDPSGRLGCRVWSWKDSPERIWLEITKENGTSFTTTLTLDSAKAFGADLLAAAEAGA